MGGGVHHPNAGLAARHGGKAQGHGKDPILKEPGAKVLGQLDVAQHHGHDGRLRAPGIQPQLCQAVLDIVRVLPQLVDEFGIAVDVVDGGQAGGRIGRSQRAGEQVGPGLLADIVDDHLAAGNHAAHHAECLGQGADLDVKLSLQSKVADDALAPAQNALSVRVVDHGQQAVPFGDRENLVQGRHVAVHAEHPIGDDHATAIVEQVLLDLGLQIGRIAVLIDDDLGPRQARPVNDAGVVQPVGKEDVLFAGGPIAPDQRRDGCLVGAKTALDEERGLDRLERGQAPLALCVQRLRAGDGAHGSGPHAPVVDGALGCLLDRGVVGQPEIVVGAKVEHLLSVHGHPGAGRRTHGADVDQAPLAGQAVEFLFHKRVFVWHRWLLGGGSFRYQVSSCGLRSGSP